MATTAARFLFTASPSDDTISTFAIDDATGRPIQSHITDAYQAHPGPKPSTGAQPTAIAVDPAGSLLFVAMAGLQQAGTFKIAADGTLTRLGVYCATGKGPKSIVVHPNGSNLYVLTQDGIEFLTANKQTGLQSIGSIQLRGFHALALHPGGRHAYATHAPLTGSSIGPGGGNPGSPGSPSGAGLSHFAIDAQGKLVPVSDMSIGSTLTPVSLTVHPGGGCLFIACNNTGPGTTADQLMAFPLDPKGQIAAQPGAQLDLTMPTNHAVRYEAGAMAASGDGGLVFVGCTHLTQDGSERDGGILSIACNADGKGLRLIAEARGGAQPIAMQSVDASKRLYVLNGDQQPGDQQSQIAAYSRSGANDLAALATSPVTRTRKGATSLAFAFGTPLHLKASTLISVPRMEVSAADVSYMNMAGSSEALTGGAKVPDGGSPWAMAVRPHDVMGPTRFPSPATEVADLYVAHMTSPVLSWFKIDQAGAPQRQPGLPSMLPSGQTEIALHPSGKFAYVLMEDGHGTISLATMTLAPGGMPTLVSGSTFVVPGQNPAGLVVDPRGQLLYAATSGSSANVNGTFMTFRINPASGVPSLWSTSDAGLQPIQLLIDPTGQFLFVANHGDSTDADGSIQTFIVDGQSPPFNLPPIFKPRFAPRALAMDPGGAVLYVAGEVARPAGATTSGMVQALFVNATRGSLHDTGVQQAFNWAVFGLACHPTGSAIYVGEKDSGAPGPNWPIETYSTGPMQPWSGPLAGYNFIPTFARMAGSSTMPVHRPTRFAIAAAWR